MLAMQLAVETNGEGPLVSLLLRMRLVLHRNFIPYIIITQDSLHIVMFWSIFLRIALEISCKSWDFR